MPGILNESAGMTRSTLSKAEQILKKLSLEEKVAIVGASDWWRTTRIQRGNELILPHLKTTDGPNGARGESYVSGVKAACFPSAENCAASFNINLVQKVAKAIAVEARTKSSDVLLAPTVCPVRSPLGGRNHETFGEDPFVLGSMGAAYVNGCQSEGIAATPKHFVASEVEYRRRFVSAEIEERALREIYLMPFQIILKKSDPWCWMTSYNRLNGTYTSEHPRLLREILREEWGFKGLVMSDWVGTMSTVEAMQAGLDLEIPAPLFFRGERLIEAIHKGKVSRNTLDERAMKVIELLLKTRRMQDPDDKVEYYEENSERDELIASAAAEGIVLLKNMNSVLPLKKGTTIAVIGQHAVQCPIMGGGSARVPVEHRISPLQGLSAAGVEYTYKPGVPVYKAVPGPARRILSPTKTSSVPEKEEVPVRIEWFNGSTIGSGLIREELVGTTEYMIKERWPSWLDVDYCTRMTFDLTPESSGPHVFSVISTGQAKLYVDGVEIYEREQEPKLQREAFYFYRTELERLVTFEMRAGKRYSVVLESWATPLDIVKASVGGEVVQGSGVGFMEHVDVATRIAEAASAAATHDSAIVFVGTTPEFESEGYDRTTMDLTADQYSLIEAVTRANPSTILVNISGSPVTLSRVYDKLAGLVQVFFGGQESGTSIARILTGETNPSGCLPITWPHRIEDNPAHGNWPGTADDIIRYEEGIYVGYRHYEKRGIKPLFPFGFGLSYTSFELSNCQISNAASLTENTGLTVTATVQNTGFVSGQVVVQFYVRRVPMNEGGSNSRFDRPVKELKAFVKPLLDAGSSTSITVSLNKYAVSCYDAKGGFWCAEAGTYEVMAGFSSVDIFSTARFEVEQEFHWTGL